MQFGLFLPLGAFLGWLVIYWRSTLVALFCKEPAACDACAQYDTMGFQCV